MTVKQKTDASKGVGTSKRTTKLKARSYGKKAVNFLLTFVMVTSLCFSSGLTALAEGVNDAAADQGIAAQAEEGIATQATGFEEATPDASAVPDYYTVAGADEQQSGYTLYYYTLDGTNYYRVYGTVDGASIGYYAFDEASGVVDTSQLIDGAAEQQAIAGSQGADETTESSIAPMSEEGEGGIAPQATGEDVNGATWSIVTNKTGNEWSPEGTPDVNIDSYTAAVGENVQYTVNIKFPAGSEANAKSFSITAPKGTHFVEVTGKTNDTSDLPANLKAAGVTAATQSTENTRNQIQSLEFTRDVISTSDTYTSINGTALDNNLGSGTLTYNFGSNASGNLDGILMYVSVAVDGHADPLHTPSFNTQVANVGDTTTHTGTDSPLSFKATLVNGTAHKTDSFNLKCNSGLARAGVDSPEWLSTIRKTDTTYQVGSTSGSVSGVTRLSYRAQAPTGTGSWVATDDIVVRFQLPIGSKYEGEPANSLWGGTNVTVDTSNFSTEKGGYIEYHASKVANTGKAWLLPNPLVSFSSDYYDGTVNDLGPTGPVVTYKPDGKTIDTITKSCNAYLGTAQLWVKETGMSEYSYLSVIEPAVTFKTEPLKLDLATDTIVNLNANNDFKGSQLLAAVSYNASKLDTDSLNVPYNLNFGTGLGVTGLSFPVPFTGTVYTLMHPAGISLTSASNYGVEDSHGNDYIVSVEGVLDKIPALSSVGYPEGGGSGNFASLGAISGRVLNEAGDISVTLNGDNTKNVSFANTMLRGTPNSINKLTNSQGVDTSTFYPGEEMTVQVTPSQSIGDIGTYQGTYTNPTFTVTVPKDMTFVSAKVTSDNPGVLGYSTGTDFISLATDTVTTNSDGLEVHTFTWPSGLLWQEAGLPSGDGAGALSFFYTLRINPDAAYNGEPLSTGSSTSLNFGYDAAYRPGLPYKINQVPEIRVTTGIKDQSDIGDYYNYNSANPETTTAPVAPGNDALIKLGYVNKAANDYEGFIMYMDIPQDGQSLNNFNNKEDVDPYNNAAQDTTEEWTGKLTGPITAPGFNVLYATNGSASSKSVTQMNTDQTDPIEGATWKTAAEIGTDWSSVKFVKFEADHNVVAGETGTIDFNIKVSDTDAFEGDTDYFRIMFQQELQKGVSGKVNRFGGVFAAVAATTMLEGFVFNDNDGDGLYIPANGDTLYTGTDITINVKDTVSNLTYSVPAANLSDWLKTLMRDRNYDLTAVNNETGKTFSITNATSTPASSTDYKIDSDFTANGASASFTINPVTVETAMVAAGGNKADANNHFIGLGIVPTYKVTYAAGDHGTMTPSTASEDVGAGQSPTESKIPALSPGIGYENDGWTIDKDVTATEDVVVPDPANPGQTKTITKGSTIPSGTVLTTDQVSKIKVIENLTVTGHYTANADKEVSITKTFLGKVDGGDVDPTAEIVKGDTVRYTIHVANNHDVAQTNIAIIESPENLTITSVTSDDSITWASPTITVRGLAAGASTDITVDATVDDNGAFKNGIATDKNTGTFTMDKQLVTATGELFTGDVYQGSTVYYKLTMTNGTEANTGETITDTMIGMTGNAEKVSGTGTFNAATGEWSTGAVAANTSVSIIIKAKVATDTHSITNSITNPHADPVIITNPVKENNGSVVKMLKSVTDGGAIGGKAVYEITVTNTGATVMSGYEVIENPTGLTIDSVTGTDVTWDAGTKTITFNNVAANNGTKTATVTCTINADPFKNKVEPGVKDGDYTITKTRVTDKTGATEATGNVLNGDTVYYKLELSNGATAIDAAGIDITDTATNLSDGKYAADDAAFNGTWNTGAVAANTKASVVVKYTVNNGCDYISNAITAPNGETDIITTPVDRSQKDVTSVKTLTTTGEIKVGDTVTYKITVTNPNTDALTNVKLNETMTGLSNLTVTAPATGVAYTNGQLVFASLAAGNTDVTVTAKVEADSFANGVTNPVPPVIDELFTLDKIRCDATGAAATNKVLAGDTVYYKLSIENTGAKDIAAGKEVADAFSGLTYVGTEGTVTGTVATDGSKWTAPAVAAGDTASVILKFTVNADATLATNTATCEGQTKVVTDRVVGDEQKGVQVTKTLATTGEIAVGDTVEYTITAKNTGTEDLTSVVLLEQPVGLSNLAITDPTTGVSLANNRITIDELDAGATITIKLSAEVTAVSFTNGLSNPVTDFTLDKVRTDSQGNVTTATVAEGDTAYYKITITNTGDEVLPEKTVTDTLSAGLTYVSAAGDGTMSADGKTWTTPAALAVGATASTVITTKVTATAGSTITNTATCEGQTKVVTDIVSKYGIYAEGFGMTSSAAKELFGSSADSMDLAAAPYNNASATTDGDPTTNIGQTIDPDDWAAIQAGTPGTYYVTYSNDDDPAGNTKITVPIIISGEDVNGRYAVKAKDAHLSPSAAVAAFGTSTDSMDLAAAPYNNASATTDGDPTTNIGQTIDPDDWAAIQAGTLGKYPVTYTNDDDATGATKQIVLVDITDGIVEDDVYTVDATDIAMTSAAAIALFGSSTDSMDLADAAYQNATATTNGIDTTNIGQTIDPDDWAAIQAGTPGVYLVTYSNNDDTSGNTAKTVTVTIGNNFENGNYKVAAQDTALSPTAAKLAFGSSTDTMDLGTPSYNNATAETKTNGTWAPTTNISNSIDPDDWTAIKAGTKGDYPVTYFNDDDATGNTKIIALVTIGQEIPRGEYKIDATSVSLTTEAAKLAFGSSTDPKDLMGTLYNKVSAQTKDGDGNWGDTTNISQVIDPADWAAIQAGTPGTYYVTYVNDDDPTGNTKKTVSVVIDDYGILNTGLTAHDFDYATGISSPEITDAIARQLADAAGFDDGGNPITADKIIPDATQLAAINAAKDAGLTGPYPLTFVNSVTGEIANIVVTLTGEPKITLTKTVSTDKAAPGDTVVYTITAKNDSEVLAKGVWTKDIVPENTTFVSCDALGSHESANGQEYVSWFATSIEPGDSITYTMKVTVNECQDGTGVKNIALYEITGSDTEPADLSGTPTGGVSNEAVFTVNHSAAYAKTSKLAKTGDDMSLMVIALGFASLACAAGALGLRRRRQY